MKTILKLILTFTCIIIASGSKFINAHSIIGTKAPNNSFNLESFSGYTTTPFTPFSKDSTNIKQHIPFTSRATGTIFGIVYYDTDGNGTKQNEPGIANISITINESNGNQQTIITQPDGSWTATVEEGNTTIIIDESPLDIALIPTEGASTTTINVLPNTINNVGNGYFLNLGSCEAGGLHSPVYYHNGGVGISNNLEPHVDQLSFIDTATPESFGSGITLLPRSDINAQTFLQLDGVDQPTLQQAVENNDYVEFSFTTNQTQMGGVINAFSQNVLEPDVLPIQQYGHKTAIFISNDSFLSRTLLKQDHIINEISQGFKFINVDKPYYLAPNKLYTIRMYLYDAPPNANGMASHDDFGLQIASCEVGLINGLVYSDSNNNGTQDNNELGLPNIEVVINDVDLNEYKTYTDNDGLWKSAVISGDAYVTINEASLPMGAVATEEIVNPINVIPGMNTNVGSSGFNIPIPTGTINGIVYNDINANSSQDSGENGLEGIEVTITNANNETQTVTTNATGNWTATVIEGNASIDVDESTLPTGTVKTEEIVSPINVIPGMNTNVGSSGFNIPIPTGIINGIVYNDINANSSQDSGENGLEGIEVTITNANSEIQTVTTNATGNWTATVIEGNASIDVDETTLPTGAIQTEEIVSPIIVTAGGNTNVGSSGYNWPTTNETGTIYGLVYNDVDGNGVKGNEPGMRDVNINITDANGDQQTVTTSSQGIWTATLALGLATITVDQTTLPDGFVITDGDNSYTLNIVANPNPDAPANGYFLDLGSCDSGGLRSPEYFHNEGVGDENNLLPGYDNSSFVTQASSETFGSGITLLPRDASNNQSYLQLDNVNQSSLALAQQDNDYVEFNFLTNETQVGGVINGFTQNPLEIGTLPAQEYRHKIAILISNDAFVSYTILKEDYIINGAMPALKNINVDKPYYLIPNETYTVRVYFYDAPASANNIATHDDFGLLIASCNVGQINGTVYDDRNANSSQDTGEPGLPNIAVEIIDIDGNEYRAYTNSNGLWKAAVIAVNNGNTPPSASVTIDETTLPTGAVQTEEIVSPIIVTSGENTNAGSSGYNWPTTNETGSIYGLVYNDVDGNGMKENEPGMRDVDINITDANGDQQTVTTSSQGNWTATLPIGTATITIDQTTLPDGVILTDGEDSFDVNVITGPNNVFSVNGYFLDLGSCDSGGLISPEYFHNQGVGVDNYLSPGYDNSSFVTNASSETFGSGITLLPRDASNNQSYLQLDNVDQSSLALAQQDNDYVQFSFTTNDTQIGGVINGFSQNPLEVGTLPTQQYGHKMAILISDNSFVSYTVLKEGYTIHETAPELSYVNMDEPYYLIPEHTYTVRIYFYDARVSANNIATHDDFGLQIASCGVGQITGTVYNDLNTSNTIDSGEPGFSNVSISIVDIDGNEHTTITDANGRWKAAIIEGNATVTIDETTLPTGATPTEVISNPVTINAGMTTNDVNSGYSIPNSNETGTIYGLVYNDLNANNSQDNGESGFSDITVTITDANGEIQTVTTNATGNWTAIVIEGNASIEVDESTVLANANQTEGENPNTIMVVPNANTDAGNDGYNIPIPSGTINGLVYNDLNANNSQDSGEPGFSDITVTITDANGEIQTVTTNATGNWTANVIEGNASIEVDESTVLADASQTEGENPNTISVVPNVNTNAGNDGYNIPIQTGTINGTVYNDLNESGSQNSGEPGFSGIKITITNANNEEQFATTDTNGNWTAIVIEGSATITVDENDLPAGINQIEGENPNTAIVIANTNTSAGRDGYHIPILKATVKGIVYNDINANDTQDNSEPGFSGIEVTITDSNDEQQTVTTDSNGNWTANITTGEATIEIKANSDEDEDEGNNFLLNNFIQTEGTNPSSITIIPNTENFGGADGFTTPKVKIYNAISPNGDGINDELVIENVEYYSENEFKVYNRWGIKLFELSEYGQNNRTFKGLTSNGAIMPSGSYLCTFKYEDFSDEEKMISTILYIQR